MTRQNSGLQNLNAVVVKSMTLAIANINLILKVHYRVMKLKNRVHTMSIINLQNRKSPIEMEVKWYNKSKIKDLYFNLEI